MEENLLVSILMTAYNREHYIREAIESVLVSTYKNWELIIIDDCSKDKTVQIAGEYAKGDARIKIYENKKNLGDYPNRNYAASLANGEFIIYVDSDDKILSNGISNLVKCMNSFPLASFGMYSRLSGAPFVLNSTAAIHEHFFKKPFLMMGPGGTIQRLSFFREVNGYPEKYGPANDMYYNLKVCCYSEIVLLPFEFMWYRRHAGQEINNTTSYLHNTYLYLKDAIAELPLPLNDSQKAWIIKKNKRRFAVNLIKVFATSLDVSKIRSACAKSKFTFFDFLEGIFH
ncbi:glycosyltransferase family A protein [Ferruginibacter paludis]|uniref:glycosyltransferase family 2 protein n=1 Tax=Ferruginibacter paludis TaxID=1310417 RepID=UPI0025B4153E|nr:glycosyltransferase family A protein [Ferruginibacter paludis]MDN3655861.1 glycosyltransferase family A protein [Ferruginibacter paludis]